ncbi:tRNA (guanine(26)-N(2))-dimethyltransferase [Sparassis crispa]|uniref:tRNA (guanine(26)-N(2))-dimethyltransferase n=1 Tax=Sparassis crispa TaxID=139825 RepID=A0A401GJ06_9APHY|nr:tRNA (guanine(26)-N(2))-dimethyltransferase [Sparassis crispa]GBE82152.1 tRNA (guanine(26)-N(2))-dimethyltransferase [Sparassis crispa]
MTAEAPIAVPEGFTLHTENNSYILRSADNEAFLNPVQEFNRDLSVACIRTWSELLNEEKENKWRQGQEKRARKLEKGPKAKRAKIETSASDAVEEADPGEAKPEVKTDDVPPPSEESGSAESPTKIASDSYKQKEYRPYKSVILEALSATGLRSIRYAKEIPLVKYVIANDLSPTAVAAMRRNIEINGLGGEEGSGQGSSGSAEAGSSQGPAKSPKVRVNEGDACVLMYNHHAEKERVDVVDLDPYGTAAPFIDAAVQCVTDGGLLCVTCTDLAVLATLNYPEKCFSNYGGTSVRAEYCHEAALRLVLNTISTSAARYGRYIQPLLSLSIDFYVRIFVRINSSPTEVKKAFSGCQAFYNQPLGRIVEQVHEASGNINLQYKAHTGPTAADKCPECNSILHIAGPMWSGSLHDTAFVGRVLQHVEASEGKYGTATRMKGMLSVAKEELDIPFYFTPPKIAGFFHCVCPSLDDVASALLNAGHQISRSHAAAGSLKTTATRAELYDMYRSWIKTHPVKMEKISQTSPTHHLLSRELKTEANFKKHPQWMTSKASHVKLVRYQENPLPNWGPGKKAGSGTKRKRDQADD